MIAKLLVYLWRIRNYERIPRLPPGMLASHFEGRDLTIDERRVLARFGARDPAGVKIAQRRRKAEDIDALVDELDHHQVSRKIMHKLDLIIGRVLHSSRHYPHQAEILRETRPVSSEVELRRRELDRRLKVAKAIGRKNDDYK